jgi:hypothetical protein
VVVSNQPYLEENAKFEEYYKVGLYKLNAVDPQLESARFQPLSL